MDSKFNGDGMDFIMREVEEGRTIVRSFWTGFVTASFIFLIIYILRALYETYL